MSKSQLWYQNWLRQTCNLYFVCLYLFHICLVVHRFVLYWGILLRTTWVSLALYLKSPLPDSLHQIVITSLYKNWSNVFGYNQRKTEILWILEVKKILKMVGYHEIGGGGRVVW